MRMLLKFWMVLAVLFLSETHGRLPHESSTDDDPVVEAESKTKALRLHQALKRRPAPGFLLDRFIDAWIEASSLEDLEQFLRQQAESQNTPSDHSLLAFFYVKQSDNIRAQTHFRLALARNSNLPIVWYEKALAAARAMDFDSAIQDLTTAAQVNAADARPDQELGLKIAKQQAAIQLRCNDLAAALVVYSQTLPSVGRETWQDGCRIPPIGARVGGRREPAPSAN